MPDPRNEQNKGLPGTHTGPAQPIPDDPGQTPQPNPVPRPDLGDDTDGDVPPSERQKLPQSSEETFGEEAR